MNLFQTVSKYNNKTKMQRQRKMLIRRNCGWLPRLITTATKKETTCDDHSDVVHTTTRTTSTSQEMYRYAYCWTVITATVLVVVLNYCSSIQHLSSSRSIFIDAYHLYIPSTTSYISTSMRKMTIHQQRRNTQFSRPFISIMASYSPPPTTALQMVTHKLWDRLQIEEDDEPMWYLINCVATNEIDLLRQCRSIFAQMEQTDPSIKKDVIKFVVPTEKKTRSHGANKMVTEIKVKYPGYVFGKLRLCPKVYESIQNLDLCRSWMGTVNHKGYKKLPPVPLALNEDEIENFGLEDVNADDNFDNNDHSNYDLDGSTMSADGIIVDSSEDDDDDDSNDNYDEEYSDPMYKNVDKKSLKQYKGLKVEDMVKVIQKGKFYNEDGIVRRLKDGQLFVRFYTYGTMFEEWLEPTAVRKLTPEEVLRGLSGSTQPITQDDFDRTNNIVDPNKPMNIRDALQRTGGKNALGSGGSGNNFNDRNRRQDRIADRYKGSTYNPYEKRDADRNWDWYKEQQQSTKNDNGVVARDNDWTVRAGSSSKNVESDVDSQWGRNKSQRQERKDVRKSSLLPNNNNRNENQSRNYNSNRLTEAAIDGTADWSAFVSSSLPSSKEIAPVPTNDNSADDFFASLMSDLKQDLAPLSSRDHRPQQQSQSNFRPPTVPEPVSPNNANYAADDFFSSLMSDLNKDIDSPSSTTIAKQESNLFPEEHSKLLNSYSQSNDDDFFASLLSDLKTDIPNTASKSISQASRMPTMEIKHKIQQDDDFFASLEAELESSMKSDSSSKSTITNIHNRENIGLAKLNNENNRSKTSPEESSPSDLNKKTIPALKDMLRERGLKVGGTKSELIERLLNA